MAELADVLNQDAFSMASMSRGIDRAPTQPRELRDAGLFVQEGVRTNVVGVEYQNGKLNIAPIDDRGDPVSEGSDPDRVIRYIKTVRVAQSKTIQASELAFVRDIDSVDRAVSDLQSHIANVQMGPTGLWSQVQNRMELMRLGAMQGKVLDQNGRVVWDFYDLFGIPEPPTIQLSLATLDNGTLREKLESQVVRPMRRKAAGLVMQGVEAWCGEEFWDGLMKNPEFYKSYNEQQQGEERRAGTLGTAVRFSGILWREYFGADDGSSVNIAPDRAKVIPSGETGMFKHIMSPGESFADLGQVGQEMYSYITRDPEGLDRFVKLWAMSYPGMFNERPDLVFDLQVV